MLNLIVNGILIGTRATIVMDVWALVLSLLPVNLAPTGARRPLVLAFA